MHKVTWILATLFFVVEMFIESKFRVEIKIGVKNVHPDQPTHLSIEPPPQQLTATFYDVNLVEKCRKMSENVGKFCRKMSKIVLKCRKMS